MFIILSFIFSAVIIFMIVRVIYKVLGKIYGILSQLKAKNRELSFELRQISNKLSDIQNENVELETRLDRLSEKMLSIEIENVEKIEQLTVVFELLTEKFEQLSYASVYMGQANGAFPINSEKLTLVHGSDVGPYYIFQEFTNIPYFYNLKVLDIDWQLIGNNNLPDLIYPVGVNINVNKLILRNVNCSFHQRKIFENYPNLEELEINIGSGSGSRFDMSKYCNPSTKLKKIVFNQNKNINIDFTGSNIDYTPLTEYYSTRGVEVVVNVV